MLNGATEKFVYNSLNKIIQNITFFVIVFGVSEYANGAFRGPIDFCIFWQFG